MITFKCSNCDKNYSVPDEYAGKKMRCKVCQNVNEIPGTEETLRSVEDSVAAYNNLINELYQYEKHAPAINE